MGQLRKLPFLFGIIARNDAGRRKPKTFKLFHKFVGDSKSVHYPGHVPVLTLPEDWDSE
jgi:hypothetical protein